MQLSPLTLVVDLALKHIANSTFLARVCTVVLIQYPLSGVRNLYLCNE